MKLLQNCCAIQNYQIEITSFLLKEKVCVIKKTTYVIELKGEILQNTCQSNKVLSFLRMNYGSFLITGENKENGKCTLHSKLTLNQQNRNRQRTQKNILLVKR